MSMFAHRFASHAAIVTGGASGLGKAVAARIFAERGTVTRWDLDADALAGTNVEFGGSHVEALDVSDTDAVARAAEASNAALGRGREIGGDDLLHGIEGVQLHHRIDLRHVGQVRCPLTRAAF